MLYLSGCKAPAIADDLRNGTMGLLNTPATSYALDGVKVWAADNGCYADTYPGDDAFMAWLGRLQHRQADCLFVAAPDVVGDGAATLALFPAMASRLRAAGWPVALVGQDGMEGMDVPWGLCDWLFVGGTTEWKLGAGAVELIRQAHAVGVRVHVGRVNSRKRFGYFAGLDCDTADGTKIAFSPDTNAEMVREWMAACEQLPLF